MIRIVAGTDLTSYLRNVDLRGHFGTTEPVGELSAKVGTALDILSELDVDALNSVMTWTSQIVWLEFSALSSRTMLTSSTFPALPHCTFVTSKALRHLPPMTVQGEENPYFLAENLYHESLHQELSTWLVLGEVLDPSFDTATSRLISVPWREQRWEPDRVLHATYVYAGILPLRRKAVSLGLVGSDCLAEGERALEYLRSQLDACRSVLRQSGQAFLSRLSGKDG
ncbi:aKG-HExxH-type peptide beta-hydroxylase [Rhizobium sp. CF142]|uniref:aKG-HExxH-type peptide beta-hydroxylase n=1 Tax=Rhizobium sp. CF142 TaxID=1144314 RepID=UPI0012F67F05|nr:HEXXH motif-containing putative peptide modification protein [Rhizobium sp. CF142]